MLHSTAHARSFDTFSATGVAAGGTLDQASDHAPPRDTLARYIEGWGEADPDKILAATAPGYRFCDPFVGTFSQRSLRRYFEQLEVRFAFEGSAGQSDLIFLLRCRLPANQQGKLQFWREAPRLGLTGVSEIEVGEGGVVSERIAYDLNLAAYLLRNDRI